MDDPTAPPTTPQPPLLAAVDGAWRAVVKAAESFDPDYLSVADKTKLVGRLSSLNAAVTALSMRTLAGASDAAEDQGARDPGIWMAGLTHSEFKNGRGQYWLGRRLLKRPVVASAFGRGEVSAEHVRAVLASLDDLPADLNEETYARAEKHLLALCGEHTPREVRMLGRKILEVLAPDLAEAHLGKLLENEEARAAEQCRASLYDRGETGEIHAVLPKPAWLTLKKTLDALASPKRNDPAFDDLDLGQKRGRALVEMIERLPVDAFPTAGRAPVQTIVTLDITQLLADHGHATLDDGTLVTAGMARQTACRSGVIPAVLGGGSEVLDLGRRHRFSTTPQVMAMRLQQATCAGDGCTVPAAWCDAHHLDQWARGGRTDLKRLSLLCGHHHRLIHDPTYRATWHPTGAVTFHRVNGRT